MGLLQPQQVAEQLCHVGLALESRLEGTTGTIAAA